MKKSKKLINKVADALAERLAAREPVVAEDIDYDNESFEQAAEAANLAAITNHQFDQLLQLGVVRNDQEVAIHDDVRGLTEN